MSVVRPLIAMGTVLFAVSEPSLGDIDLVRYSLTQGGLLVVVLVLLWVYRKDMQRIAGKDDEKIYVLTELVKGNTAAITQNTEVVKSMHRRMDKAEGNHERRDDRH